jgi:hypothetical protein
MRIEYDIYQRLMWDPGFRRRFLADREATIAGSYPDCREPGLFTQLNASGLEEEAFRRMAALYRTSKDMLPRSHNLLMSFCGIAFFEAVLADFFDFTQSGRRAGKSLEILEPFDGYAVGPMILDLAESWPGENMGWIRGVVRYEWALWQARRVAGGWPPLRITPPLAEGATLVSTDYDLKALLREITRLENSAVGSEVFLWRIEPGPGSYHAAIYPRDGQVMEAKLDAASFAELKEAIARERPCDMNEDLKGTVAKIGLILASSFLCCSREGTYGEIVPDMSGVVEPQPH